jgi:two-component SAPR family response regulator
MPKSEKFNQIENNVLFYDFYMSQEDYVWVLESKKQLLSLWLTTIGSRVDQQLSLQ